MIIVICLNSVCCLLALSRGKAAARSRVKALSESVELLRLVVRARVREGMRRRPRQRRPGTGRELVWAHALLRAPGQRRGGARAGADRGARPRRGHLFGLRLRLGRCTALLLQPGRHNLLQPAAPARHRVLHHRPVPDHYSPGQSAHFCTRGRCRAGEKRGWPTERSGAGRHWTRRWSACCEQ